MKEIRLLGEQRIISGTDSDAMPQPSRAVALLGYLVLRTGMAQSRQHLAAVFWPDSGEAQARTNLRRELHHLRLLLGPDPSLVIGIATLAWCDSPSCRVDVRVFRTERAAAMAAWAAGDRPGFLAHAAAAIGEYRGELAPGSFDDWVIDERERLRRECVDLCDLAVTGWHEAGDLFRAVEVARFRIRLEPHEETGYRRLMELQMEAGDRAAAMSTYHRCASVLEQELDMAPSPDTESLVARLLAPLPASSHRSESVETRARLGSAGLSLVGREAEFAALTRCWRQAADGRSGLVVVSGEAGIGKSRLVAEVAAMAAAEGAVVATARCFGLQGQIALAPIADWLRGPAVRAAVSTLDPVWRTEVERLVPRREARPPDEAAGQPSGARRTPSAEGLRAMADAWQRHRFFEGLARAVLGAARPTLLVLDDLQWCDQETMAWLAFLLGFADGSPVLVAATVRTDELADNQDVSATLKALRSAGSVTEVALSPLERDQTAELAESVLGRPLAPAQRRLLYAATGGFPLFVVEASRSLPGVGAPDASEPGADLTAVLRRRLELPSPAAREVAGLAAALGRDFSLDLLSEASDLDCDTLVRAVDELWRHRILRVQRTGYDFSHDLLRDAAYASVSPARRWLLHRRLAQGVELLYSGGLDEVAAMLAEQYDRGGRPDRALHYFARAAEVAAGTFAHAEAVRLYRRCLVLVARLSGRERDVRELEVLQAMSAPLTASQGYSSREVQKALEKSVSLAERLNKPAQLLAGLVGLWSVCFVQGRIALGHKVATRALSLAEADRELAGQAHFAFAGGATSLGRPASAIPHFDLALELSPGTVSLVVGSRPDVHAQAFAAHACWLLGESDQAAERCADAIARARAADHPYSVAVALAYAAVTHQISGDRAAAGEVVAELSGLCRRHGFAYYSEWALIVSGWTVGGEQGAGRIREGIGRLRSQGAHTRMPYWSSLLAEVLIADKHFEAARAVLDAARIGAEQRDDLWWLPEVLRLRARLEPGPDAVSILERAADIAARQQSRVLESRCRRDLADRTVREASRRVPVAAFGANGSRTRGA
ncbi:AAA family ATPase [Streptomyces sp. NPDC002588]|uniref:ATP-binding protein n=1 Tax=Streptomyces sp. NPDC002588 TaxID=3154419 RepID=UPI003322BB6F